MVKACDEVYYTSYNGRDGCRERHIHKQGGHIAIVIGMQRIIP